MKVSASDKGATLLLLVGKDIDQVKHSHTRYESICDIGPPADIGGFDGGPGGCPFGGGRHCERLRLEDGEL